MGLQAFTSVHKMNHVKYVQSLLVDLSGVDSYVKSEIPLNIDPPRCDHQGYAHLMEKVRMSEPPYLRPATWARESPVFLDTDHHDIVAPPRYVDAFSTVKVFTRPGDVLKSATLSMSNTILKRVDLLGNSNEFTFFDSPIACFLEFNSINVNECKIAFEYYQKSCDCARTVRLTAIVVDDFTRSKIFERYIDLQK
jgi:hypothetical protein